MSEPNIPDDLRYSTDDEWARGGGSVTIGITDYAQEQLGDIVFVELPEVGASIEKGATFGVIESVKAVSDLCAPISGTVSAINEALVDNPERVNEDCYGDGWIIQVTPSAAAELDALLDADAYRSSVAERSS